MKNRKGFTLIELLAVVTILGIVMVVSIPAVNRWLAKGKNESLESQKQTLVMASESYAQANSKYLPKRVGESVDIPISNLKKSNYLKDDIVNADKKSCMENSYVRVYKYDKTKYTYTAFVYCEGEEVPTEPPIPKPSIGITFSDEKDNTNYSTNVNITSLKITIDGGTNNGEALGISGYNYTISVNYSNDPNAKLVEIYNSGSLNADGRKNLVIQRSLGDYVDITTVNNFIVTVTAYNQAGGYLEKTATSSYQDVDKPICGTITGQAGENEWDKTWRRKTISVKCSDGDGSGCVKDSYTHTFDTQMNIGYITISDNAGNTRDCPVRVHLDWTRPTVTINAYKRNADGSAGAKVGSVTADNAHSNVTLSSYTGGYGGNNWLNLGNFPNGIIYEAVTSDNIILNQGKWFENTRGLWLPDSRIDSTIVEKSKKTFTSSDNKARYPIVDEGFRKARFEFTDKALNDITINIVSPIDRTLPTATCSKSHLDTEDGVTVTVNCSDGGSGCQEAQRNHYGIKSSQNFSTIDNAGNLRNEACSVGVSSYACHPYQYACGSYACGSYECGCNGYCYRGANGVGGVFCCVHKYCTSYCTAYCTGWNTCYR